MGDFFSGLWRDHRDTVFLFGRRLASALIIAGAACLVIGVNDRLNRKAAGKLGLDGTLASVLRITVRYSTVIVALIMILDTFGFNTTSLVAVLGTAGLAIGLAIKDTLSSIAAGIVLLFLRYYRQGDYIETGTVSGTVRDMDLFATTLETPDGIYISVPNSDILGAPVRNYTRNGRRRMELAVSISYGDSIETAFQVLRDIGSAESRFLPDPAPQVIVKSLGDSGVNLALRAWAANDVYWPVFFEQSRNIKEKVEAAGLTIPFPQRDIHIVRNG